MASSAAGESLGSLLLTLAKSGSWSELNSKLSGTDPSTLNEVAKSGQSVLHLATEAGQSALVSQLLTMGADPNIQDAHGQTALHIALSTERGTCCLKAFLIPDHLKSLDLTLADSFGRSVLHWTVQRGDVECLKTFTHSLISIDGTSTKSPTTSAGCAPPMKESALKRTLKQQTNSKESCLHWAVANEQWLCVSHLLELEEHMDLTLLDSEQRTAADLIDPGMRDTVAVARALWEATEEQKRRVLVEQQRMEQLSESKKIKGTASTKKSSGSGRKKKKMKISLSKK